MSEAPAGRPAGVRTIQLENDRVRVSLWTFTPEAATGWHRHEHDYVVVPMTTGALRIRSAEGETTAELVTGLAYFRRAGVEHDVFNPNPHEFVFVETEVKGLTP